MMRHHCLSNLQSRLLSKLMFRAKRVVTAVTYTDACTRDLSFLFLPFFFFFFFSSHSHHIISTQSSQILMLCSNTCFVCLWFHHGGLSCVAALQTCVVECVEKKPRGHSRGLASPYGCTSDILLREHEHWFSFCYMRTVVYGKFTYL